MFKKLPLNRKQLVVLGRCAIYAFVGGVIVALIAGPVVGACLFLFVLGLVILGLLADA